MSGYSDWPMRVIARRLGAAYTVCEVMLDQFILNVTKGRKAKRFLRVTDDEHPCGAQLMGAVPEQFPPAALKLVAAGFDVIDLNFACPVKKVLGRCRGGFLLSDPETALAIVGRVRDALPPGVPLTVKMRRGMDDEPGEPRAVLCDLRRRVPAGRGRHYGPRPHRAAALRRRQFARVPPRGETTCRTANGAGQRRPVHRARLPRHAPRDRHGRRFGGPGRHRQSVDIRASAGVGGRRGACRRQACTGNAR